MKMNKEMLSYNNLLIKNIIDDCINLKAQAEEAGVPDKHELRTFRLISSQISDSVNDLEGLIIRGEY